jgi:hypothetical protein
MSSVSPTGLDMKFLIDSENIEVGDEIVATFVGIDASILNEFDFIVL